MAVSLLELNTFAHCISTLIIYYFWWNKPYDAEADFWIESTYLDMRVMMSLHYDRPRLLLKADGDSPLADPRNCPSGIRSPVGVKVVSFMAF